MRLWKNVCTASLCIKYTSYYILGRKLTACLVQGFKLIQFKFIPLKYSYASQLANCLNPTGYTMFRGSVKCWLPTAFTSFHFTSPPVRHRVPSHFNWPLMLDTPCSEVLWRLLATHSIRQFTLHFPSRASPCAITFQLDSTECVSAQGACLFLLLHDLHSEPTCLEISL